MLVGITTQHNMTFLDYFGDPKVNPRTYDFYVRLVIYVLAYSYVSLHLILLTEEIWPIREKGSREIFSRFFVHDKYVYDMYIATD